MILDEKNVFSMLKKRDEHSNKGDFGLLTAVCGSVLYRGAAALAVKGALRSGCGIVRLASLEKVIAGVSAKLDECIFLPLTENGNGGIAADNAEAILSCRSDAILCGCGMIRSDDTKMIVLQLLDNAVCPLILDADALNSLSGDPEPLRTAAQIPIITPHIGEMSRLTGKSIEEIKADSEGTAVIFAEKYRCVMVLKDYCTVIASPDGQTAVCDRPNPGLAKGGSGDLLTGIISSLRAQKYDAFTAAVCGVMIHSLAAEITAKRLSHFSMLPSDVADALPEVFGRNGF